jgi:hypothetical protein
VPRAGIWLGGRFLGADVHPKRSQLLLVSWVQLRENPHYRGFAADDTSGSSDKIRGHKTGSV